MKKLGIMSCAALLAISAIPAQAGNEKLIACYKMDKVPAQYEITKVLVTAAHRKYYNRNGRIELVEFPAVYRENKRLIKEAHEVMREISCN